VIRLAVIYIPGAMGLLPWVLSVQLEMSLTETFLLISLVFVFQLRIRLPGSFFGPVRATAFGQRLQQDHEQLVFPRQVSVVENTRPLNFGAPAGCTHGAVPSSPRTSRNFGEPKIRW